MYLNVLKCAFIWLWSTAAALATDVVIQKNVYGSDVTRLVTWNEEIKYILEIVKYFEVSSSKIKVVSETTYKKGK